jgi:hypothetical protein
LVDTRHASYITHTYRDILAQRIIQIGCGYEDGNDSNSLRHDPMFRLGVGRLPFDDGSSLASASTISRFEHAVSSKDIYRVSQALVEQFIASFATPPKTLIQATSTGRAHQATCLRFVGRGANQRGGAGSGTSV